MDLAKELQLAIQIAKQAGDIMREYFNGDQQRETKKDGTPVTIADKKINTLAIQEILRVFPDDGVVGEEESSADIDRSRLWFCDPIDGTKPFTWGIPTAVFSLGLIVDDKPCLGVVYDPFMDNLFTGIVGEGSYCNGRRLRVSSEGLDTGTVVATGSAERMIQSPAPYLKNLVRAGVRLACFSGGIYKSSLVAQGKLVGYMESKVMPHDLCAVHVIVTEAGGKVTTIDGGPLDYRKGFNSAIVSNGIVHDRLIQMAA